MGNVVNKQDSIQEIFCRAAERRPHALAVESGTERLTYLQLDQDSNRLANLLLDSGATRGSVLAIVATDRIRVLTSILAALKANCAFAPFDPRLPELRLKTMIEQIKPGWFMTETEHLKMLAAIAPDAQHFPLENALADYPNTTPPALESDPDQMSSIFFTSGSTGKPKAIAGRLKGLSHFVWWETGALSLDENTRGSQLTSPSWDAFLRDVFVPLSVGGTVCIPERDDLKLDGVALAKWIETSRLTILHCVPSLFRSLINAGLTADNFPDLRYVVMAGEPLLPSDVRRWTELFDDRIRLVNLYGPTETTLTKLVYFVSPADKARRSIPIGKPMPGVGAVVVDTQGRVCPRGEVGEILIRTPYRSLGYLNQPELTAQVFVPNPLSNDPQDIVYRTGDYGRLLDDGNFEFVGRKDHQVKIRGVRVELAEVESLLRSHESVKDVVVVDREDATGNKYLSAYVVLDHDTETGLLKQHLAKLLPEVMMPSAFVKLDAIPRLINGKVDRQSLPAPFADRAVYVAPRTAIEEVVAGIWSDVLEVEEVGVESSFFELGGHSLLAMTIIARVASSFRVEIPVRRIFETPTVAALSSAIEEALHKDAAAPPRLMRTPRTGSLPLSFAQQRLWFLDQLEPGSVFYNVPAAVRLCGPLNVEAVQRALDEIVRRHEILRTSFPAVNDQPVQAIAPALELPFEVIDLTAEAEAEQLVASYAKEWASLQFDLARGPLVRACLLRLDQPEHVLLFCMHHIIGDAWSISVLVNEWVTLYNAFAAGKPSPLNELPVQYADYAVWQREWLQGAVLDEQLEYWRRQLAAAPPPLSAASAGSQASQSFDGSRLNVALSESLSRELHALSRREGATLFMTLLAAFSATLQHHTRQADLLIGTPMANRRQVEVQDLIGFFLNTLVLRLNLEGDPTFRELLARAREVSLDAYAHQDVPFEKLVEELRPERSQGDNPFFQVAFTLDQVPAAQPALDGLTLSNVEIERGVAQFGLVLHLADTGERIIGTLQYQTRFFDTTTMERFLRHFEIICSEVAKSPDVRLSTLANILSEADRQTSLEQGKQVAAVSFEKLKTARRQAVV
jgi:amino acid adenylation domain-containing protein